MYAEEFLWYKSNRAFTGMENKESQIMKKLKFPHIF